MAYLARAGFDVFAMDTTGYGRSTRPAAMNDPCNLAQGSAGAVRPDLIPAPCAPSYPHAMTTIASDWNDIDARRRLRPRAAARRQRQPARWSLGGPRAGGYAAQHPEKVQKLVLLAPAYNRNAAAAPPAQCRPTASAFNTQSRDEFDANWDRQVGCPDAVRSGGRRRRVVGDARVRSGRRDVGNRRAARAADDDVGLEPGGGGEDADADADGRRARTTSRCRRIACATSTPTSARSRRCSSISPARRTTRCGRRTICCCSRRRSTGSRRLGRRREGRHAAPGLLMAEATSLARSRSARARCRGVCVGAAALRRRLRLRRSARPELQAVPERAVRRPVHVRARRSTRRAPGGYWYRGLPSWAHGYPIAEQNLMKIMNEVSFLGAHDEINTLTLDDPELFKYPVAYIIEVSWWHDDRRAGAPRCAPTCRKAASSSSTTSRPTAISAAPAGSRSRRT